MSKDLQQGKFNTDKPQENLDAYEEFFNKYKDKDITILELGVLNGGSLELWSNYFNKGKVIGIDINNVDIQKNNRTKFYQGDQKDFDLLKKVKEENAPNGYEIIIDDASHFGRETFESFTYLFKNCLKEKGIYVIEDWGTGYWPHYPDGRRADLGDHHISKHLHFETDLKYKPSGVVLKNKKRFQSHDYGMVGVVKQLIDEIGMEAMTATEYTGNTRTNSMISRIVYQPGLIFIFKK